VARWDKKKRKILLVTLDRENTVRFRVGFLRDAAITSLSENYRSKSMLLMKKK
jgi:hypothetical protein